MKICHIPTAENQKPKGPRIQGTKCPITLSKTYYTIVGMTRRAVLVLSNDIVRQEKEI